MNDLDMLGTVASSDLAEARAQAHWAAQAVAAVGNTLTSSRPDFSHTALRHVAGVLWSVEVSGARVGLRLADMTLLVEGAISREIAITGKTLAQMLGELRGALVAAGVAVVRDLERPGHDLPHHPVADGAVFPGASSEALAELAAWFGAADTAVREATAGHDAGEVTVWPHHFDIAALITVSGEPPRTVGAGMSPGDASYADPYLYVTVWPHPDHVPDDASLPAGAHWHRDGWVGAVLPGPAVATMANDGRRAQIAGFLRAAMAAGYRLHDGAGRVGASAS